MSTKAQTVNNAYQQLRISGLTVQPTPAELSLALNTLESMMAEYYNSWQLNINYNFELTPTFNALTGVELCYQAMMDLNLATRLIPPYNKAVPAELKVFASVALSNAIGIVAMQNVRMVQPSRRMPKGSGWTFRYPFYNRFQTPNPAPPVGAATNYILQGEQLNYTESFAAFLGAATIVSWELACDPLLTIVTASQSGPVISYTIMAPTQPPASFGPAQQVAITITDSLGRVEIRLINFGVSTPPVLQDTFP